jgi:hypothetical protein
MTSKSSSTYLRPVANKSASMIFFHYGDSVFSTMVQETLSLSKGMSGYSRTVLLKHDQVPSWCDFSEKDESLADVIATPTKANFFAQLVDLTRRGHYIDLFIFSHGTREAFKASTGSYTSLDWITKNDIQDELAPEKTGFSHIPIRIVWGTYCHGSTLNNNWQGAGAKASAGARFINFYPNAWGPFIGEWNKGNVGFGSAVEGSDTALVRTAAQTYISQIHAPSHNKEWGKCPFGSFVLGDKDCAKEYFTKMWFSPDSDWQNGMSGKENMNYMLREGSMSITKNTVPTW